jgi:hypothetical protein
MLSDPAEPHDPQDAGALFPDDGAAADDTLARCRECGETVRIPSGWRFDGGRCPYCGADWSGELPEGDERPRGNRKIRPSSDPWPVDGAGAVVTGGHGEEWQTVFDRRDEVAPRRWSGWLTLAAVVAGTLLVAALVWAVESHRHAVRGDVPAGSPVRESALEAARAFFEAGSWRDALPHVRDRARVEPLMAAYYAGQPFGPWGGVSFRGHRAFEMFGALFVEVDCLGGPAVPPTLLLEQRGGEFLVDWESLVDFGAFQWAGFRRDLPESFAELRVNVKRATPLPGHAEHFGIPFDRVGVFRLWFSEPGEAVLAVVDRGSATGAELEALTAWEYGRPLRLTAACRGAVGFDPVVEVGEVLGDGWVSPSPPEPAGPGPAPEEAGTGDR